MKTFILRALNGFHTVCVFGFDARAAFTKVVLPTDRLPPMSASLNTDREDSTVVVPETYSVPSTSVSLLRNEAPVMFNSPATGQITVYIQVS